VKEDHWDPTDHEKTYYRHITTGDLGWLVRREGKDCIRLDRPSQEITKVFREADWVPTTDYRPLTGYQLAQVAYEADKKLCFFLGKHDQARKDWLMLKDEERIAWRQKGPPRGGGRQELFKAIMATLERYAGK
jgi:hypothetical protein